MSPRMREIDPLLIKDRRSANIMPVPSSSTVDERRRWCQFGRSAITTTALVTVIVMSAALIYMFIILEEEGDLDFGPVIIDINVLPDDQSQVHVSSEGVYSVIYDTGINDTSPELDSFISYPVKKCFAELALVMLPPWYTASRMAMNDVLQQETMDPSNVKNARQVLLTTRDLLDVFSPVYPSHSQWGNVRNLYKDGYELVGYYQDLVRLRIKVF